MYGVAPNAPKALERTTRAAAAPLACADSSIDCAMHGPLAVPGASGQSLAAFEHMNCWRSGGGGPACIGASARRMQVARAGARRAAVATRAPWRPRSTERCSGGGGGGGEHAVSRTAQYGRVPRAVRASFARVMLLDAGALVLLCGSPVKPRAERGAWPVVVAPACVCAALASTSEPVRWSGLKRLSPLDALAM